MRMLDFFEFFPVSLTTSVLSSFLPALPPYSLLFLTSLLPSLLLFLTSYYLIFLTFLLPSLHFSLSIFCFFPCRHSRGSQPRDCFRFWPSTLFALPKSLNYKHERPLEPGTLNFTFDREQFC